MIYHACPQRKISRNTVFQVSEPLKYTAKGAKIQAKRKIPAGAGKNTFFETNRKIPLFDRQEKLRTYPEIMSIRLISGQDFKAKPGLPGNFFQTQAAAEAFDKVISCEKTHILNRPYRQKKPERIPDSEAGDWLTGTCASQ